MPNLIKSARADARRLLRYVRSAPPMDAERKLAAALLVYWEMGAKTSQTDEEREKRPGNSHVAGQMQN